MAARISLLLKNNPVHAPHYMHDSTTCLLLTCTFLLMQATSRMFLAVSAHTQGAFFFFFSPLHCSRHIASIVMSSARLGCAVVSTGLSVLAECGLVTCSALLILFLDWSWWLAPDVAAELLFEPVGLFWKSGRRSLSWGSWLSNFEHVVKNSPGSKSLYKQLTRQSGGNSHCPPYSSDILCTQEVWMNNAAENVCMCGGWMLQGLYFL